MTNSPKYCENFDIRVNTEYENEFESRYVIAVYEKENTPISSGAFRFINTRFGDGYVKTMMTGAVATPPEYRRNGYVKKIFEKAYEMAMDKGAAVALLHPFSFSYYYKFGYGKVADHLVMRCPICLIDFVPRYNELVPYTGTEEQLSDLISVYNRFSQGRMLMPVRYNDRYYKNTKIYIYYKDEKPEGYIVYKEEKILRAHHYEDGLMTVSEIAYTSPEAMRALLGFIRMYEGELDDVLFENIAMCPEIERSLSHYTHTRYQLISDVSARIINTEKILSAHKYPMEKGSFRIRVNDILPTVSGNFEVVYENGKGEVKRLSDTDEVQMTINSAELARLIYGYDAVTALQASYTEGISITCNVDDFFRAFPKRVGGIFEQF